MAWPKDFKNQWIKTTYMLRSDHFVPDDKKPAVIGANNLPIRHRGLELEIPFEVRKDRVIHNIRDFYRAAKHKGTMEEVIHMADSQGNDVSHSLRSEKSARKFVQFVESEFKARDEALAESRGILGSARHPIYS